MVDSHRGIADLFAPNAAPDSLAGRTETLTLWPPSEVEIRRTRSGFIDRAFAGDWSRARLPGSRSEVIRPVVRGHSPAAVSRTEPERRAAWYRDFANALAQRDVPGLARIASIGPVATLLRLLAARIAGLVNRADLARDAGLPPSTLGRHLDRLHRTARPCGGSSSWRRSRARPCDAARVACRSDRAQGAAVCPGSIPRRHRGPRTGTFRPPRGRSGRRDSCTYAWWRRQREQRFWRAVAPPPRPAPSLRPRAPTA